MKSMYDAIRQAAPTWSPDTPPIEPDAQTLAALGEAILRLAEDEGAMTAAGPAINADLLVAAVREAAAARCEVAPLLAWVITRLMSARQVRHA